MCEAYKKMTRLTCRILADRKGISSLEYGVLAVGIVAAVAAGAATLGSAVSTYLGTTLTALI
jgi:Flp pilus assembly pilin Flp